MRVTHRFMDEPEGASQWTSADLQAARYGYGTGGPSVIPTLRPNETANPYDRTTYASSSLVSELYSDAAQSVVAIEDARMAKGTGFFVTADGLLATDYHVIDDAQGEIRVRTADGRVYRATIEAVDRPNDLAILKVQPNSRYEVFNPLELGSSSDVMSYGAGVMAVGRPRSWGNLFASPGQVTGVRPYWQVAERGTLGSWNNESRSVIQLNMHTEKGQSGSPIVDRNGRVVGIVDLSNSKDVTSATPVESIQRLLNWTFQRRGYGDNNYYAQSPRYGAGNYYSQSPRYGADLSQTLPFTPRPETRPDYRSEPRYTAPQATWSGGPPAWASRHSRRWGR